MSYCKEMGKDQVIFLTEEDAAKPSTVELPEPAPGEAPQGLVTESGEINWGCPCLVCLSNNFHLDKHERIFVFILLWRLNAFKSVYTEYATFSNRPFLNVRCSKKFRTFICVLRIYARLNPFHYLC